MNFVMFSVFDTKSRVFLAPFLSRSEVDAARSIKASFADPMIKQSPIGAYPQDFELYSVGQFDDETALLTNTSPRFISRIDAILADPPVASTVAS